MMSRVSEVLFGDELKDFSGRLQSVSIWGLINGELLWSIVVPGYLVFMGFKASLLQSKFFFSFHLGL